MCIKLEDLQKATFSMQVGNGHGHNHNASDASKLKGLHQRYNELEAAGKLDEAIQQETINVAA